MPITTKAKSIYLAAVILVQAYFVYAATLYVKMPAILWVVAAAVVSAAGAAYYIFVRANKDEVGGYNASFLMDERRRIG